jgi:2-phosphosulfolactate phosphatase
VNLDIRRVYLPQAQEALGIVIVIDVIRAFTLAAYAFAGGASRLWLVRTVEEAFALRKREPQALLAGEVGGFLIPGFDINNSPSRVQATDVRGKLLIQRTGAGTQGAVGAMYASHLLICSLVNAHATANYARQLAQETGDPITLLPTERPEPPYNWVGEDSVCADYLEALIQEQENATGQLNENLARLEAAGRFESFQQGDPDIPFKDIALITDIDRFRFVMSGKHKQWQNITYVEVERIGAFL